MHRRRVVGIGKADKCRAGRTCACRQNGGTSGHVQYTGIRVGPGLFSTTHLAVPSPSSACAADPEHPGMGRDSKREAQGPVETKTRVDAGTTSTGRRGRQRTPAKGSLAPCDTPCPVRLSGRHHREGQQPELDCRECDDCMEVVALRRYSTEAESGVKERGGAGDVPSNPARRR